VRRSFWCGFGKCGSGSQTRTGRAQLGCPQLPQDKDDRIGTRQQLFFGKFEIDHDIHSIQVPGIRPMPRQNPPSQFTLQRSKPKDAARIAAQNELHQPVAQPANAVVEKNGMSH